MPKRPAEILLDRLNEGGLSDSKWSGVRNSFYKMIGWDPHTVPGILKVAQKMTKDSGATVDELCKVAVASSNGSQYWFSADSGKIWENHKTSGWRLVHTTTPAAGGAACLGAAEYQGRIWWATESRLHYITVDNADDNDWATDAVEDDQTFDITDADFHPFLELNLVLYIGDGNQVAQIDGTTFSSNALDVKTPLRIKSLGKYDTDLLIGTYIADEVTKSSLFRWNTSDVSFTSEDEIPEVGINAFLKGDNVVYVSCGLAGNIYIYNGRNLETYRKVPGTYTPSATGTVHPNAVANLNGEILFGFSNVAGNPADQGVYRFARHGYNYPYITDMPYPISERSGSDLVLTGVDVGAILAVGSDLYMSWKSGSNYGVDKLDYSNKLEAGYLETRVFNIGRYQLQTFPRFEVAYASLPANTSIDINYSANYGAYVETTEVDDTDRNVVYAEESPEGTTLQVKVLPTVDSNNAPEIESSNFDLPASL